MGRCEHVARPGVRAVKARMVRRFTWSVSNAPFVGASDERRMMRTWTIALVVTCWAGLLGCGPNVELKASSSGQSGQGGFPASAVGAGAETGTTTGGVGSGGMEGSGGGIPLAGTKYTAPPGYYDVVWDTKRDHLFLSTGGDGLVRVLDLKTSAWTTIQIGHRAEHMYFDTALDQVLVSVAVKEHSYTWFDVDQSGYLAVIDAATLTAGKLIHLPLDPWQIVADGAGYAYISGASGGGTHMMVVNLATGTATVPAGSGVFQNASLQIHPDKSHIYVTADDTFYRFNIGGGAFESPYYSLENQDNDHMKVGTFRIHPSGTTMYLGCGNVFQATDSQDTDMAWSAYLYLGLRDLAFRPDGAVAYLVPDPVSLAMPSVYEPLVYTLDTASLHVVATHTLGAPAERVLASETGLVLVRGTLGGDPKTEIEVVGYAAL